VDGTLKGHLIYIDHGTGFTVEGTAISTFTAGCTGTMSGRANQGQLEFTIVQVDNGEPGRADFFEISAGTYNRSDILAGGNIQVDGTFAGGKVLAHGRDCQ
jgi:hypothetical protein